jgi:hypothetical protein
MVANAGCSVDCMHESVPTSQAFAAVVAFGELSACSILTDPGRVTRAIPGLATARYALSVTWPICVRLLIVLDIRACEPEESDGRSPSNVIV